MIFRAEHTRHREVAASISVPESPAVRALSDAICRLAIVGPFHYCGAEVLSSLE